MYRSNKNIPGESTYAKGQKIFVRQIRQNIKELSRSMQSIEKMIERSRNLFNDNPTQSRSNHKIKISNSSSFIMRQREANPLFDDEGKKRQNRNQQSIINAYSIIKERHKGTDNSLVYHTIGKEGQDIYHFSPQKSKRPVSLSTHAKQQSRYNPEAKKSTIKLKHTRFLSIGNEKSDMSTKTKDYPIRLNNSSNKLQRSNKAKHVQCKTQYKQEDQGKSYKKCGTSIGQATTKKQISIKLFSKLNSKKKEKLQLNEILNDKSFKVQPPFLHKLRHNLKGGNEPYDAMEASQTKRNRFIQKISQYKFVQNYLSKNQIWGIYDKLVSENIPELKWPIIIVDEVYKKIQGAQVSQ